MGSVCNNTEEPIPPLCDSDMEVATLRAVIELKALPVVMISRSPRFMAVENPGFNGFLCVSNIIPEFRHDVIRRRRGPLIFS